MALEIKCRTRGGIVGWLEIVDLDAFVHAGPDETVVVHSECRGDHVQQTCAKRDLFDLAADPEYQR